MQLEGEKAQLFFCNMKSLAVAEMLKLCNGKISVHIKENLEQMDNDVCVSRSN